MASCAILRGGLCPCPCILSFMTSVRLSAAVFALCVSLESGAHAAAASASSNRFATMISKREEFAELKCDRRRCVLPKNSEKVNVFTRAEQKLYVLFTNCWLYSELHRYHPSLLCSQGDLTAMGKAITIRGCPGVKQNTICIKT